MRSIVEPVTVDKGSVLGTETTHPAFAQIVANRVTGTAYLYGSDFTHHAYINVRIKKSVLMRDLSRDWNFGREEYIEIALSEAQWATFVSAMNVGDGTPCTLERLNGKAIPGLPPPEDRSKQFAGEIDDHVAECIDELKALSAKVDAMNIPKGKTAEIKNSIRMAVMQLQANLPFIAKSFGEHAETVMEKAKQEIHGYTMGVIMRTGIAALGATPPLMLESKPATPPITEE